MAVDVSRQSVGFKLESTFGTRVVPDQFFRFKSVGLKPVISKYTDESHIYGTTTQTADQSLTWVSGGAGPLAGPLPNIGITDGLLQMAFGARATTTVGQPSGYSKETYTLSDALPSATFVTVVPQDVAGSTVEKLFHFPGTMVNSFTLSGEVNQTLDFTADLISKDALWSTSLVATTNSTINVTVPSTRDIRVGMNVTGTGIPANTTVASIGGPTSLTLSAAATTSATPTLTFQFSAPSSAAPSSTARIFPLTMGNVTTTFDTGGGAVAYCFKSFSTTINHNLQSDDRFCGKSQPARNGRRDVKLSLRGGVFDTMWMDLVRSNTPAVVSIQAVATQYDPNCSITLKFPSATVDPTPFADMSASQLNRLQDVDFTCNHPTSGTLSAAYVELVRTPAGS